MRSGTLALSWGRYGGFYLHRARACFGWVALTYVPVEVDEMMAAHIALRTYADDQNWLNGREFRGFPGIPASAIAKRALESNEVPK